MQSLNPFEIRASLKLNIINVIQGSEGLNPFEIRASLKRGCYERADGRGPS